MLDDQRQLPLEQQRPEAHLEGVWILRGVVGQVQKQADVVHGAVLLEVRLEEASGLHVDLEMELRSAWVLTLTLYQVSVGANANPNHLSG